MTAAQFNLSFGPMLHRSAWRSLAVFQAWALGCGGARVASSAKKGGDTGVDARIDFHDSAEGPSRQIVFSVKAGHLVPAYVRELGT